jgi:hypothetical protein
MEKTLFNIVKKHIISMFGYDEPIDDSRSDDPFSMYRVAPDPGDVLVHPSGGDGDPHPTHDNFMWQVVDRDKYPAETGGQGELDTVDGWIDTGFGYYIIEPAFEQGSHDLPKENLQYFQDYIQNERAG